MCPWCGLVGAAAYRYEPRGCASARHIPCGPSECLEPSLSSPCGGGCPSAPLRARAWGAWSPGTPCIRSGTAAGAASCRGGDGGRASCGGADPSGASFLRARRACSAVNAARACKSASSALRSSPGAPSAARPPTLLCRASCASPSAPPLALPLRAVPATSPSLIARERPASAATSAT